VRDAGEGDAEVDSGRAAEMITERVAALGGLIAMGTHGYAGVKHLLLERR
jgi:hypothetical protein